MFYLQGDWLDESSLLNLSTIRAFMLYRLSALLRGVVCDAKLSFPSAPACSGKNNHPWCLPQPLHTVSGLPDTR
jgi:hypothetical protein